MFFFFTFGNQVFEPSIKGYKDMRFVCSNCHNVAAKPVKHMNFFTLCFIPVVPFSYKKGIKCERCHYFQRTTIEELERIKQQGPLQPGYGHQTGYMQQPQPMYSPHSQYAQQPHSPYSPQTPVPPYSTK